MDKTSLLLAALLACSTAGADIYKCEDPEGNVAYLQTPCPVQKEEPAEPEVDVADDAPTFETQENDPEPQFLPDEQPVMRSFEETEECKNPLRDEIDAIEAEMLRGYTSEQSEDFKQRLIELTKEMRACGAES